jgi:hypothetical protein
LLDGSEASKGAEMDGRGEQVAQTEVGEVGEAGDEAGEREKGGLGGKGMEEGDG